MGTEHEIVENTIVQKVSRKKSNKDTETFVVLKEKKTFTMKNMLPGAIYFTRENGKEDKFDGFEVKDDITEKERKSLINNEVCKKGHLVEVLEDEAEITNANAFTEAQIFKLIKEKKNDVRFFESLIDKMDSDYSVIRMKKVLSENDMPVSLLTYCDYKLNKLEEEYLNTQKAPVDELPKGV